MFLIITDMFLIITDMFLIKIQHQKWQAQRFLGQQNESVWYSNGGYMSLYICENPLNVQHQEGTLM